MTYLSPLLPNYKKSMQGTYGPNGCATSGYICHSITGERQAEHFSPIGTLLSGLFTSLAWIFQDMRSLEEYFRKVNMQGSGKGNMRKWDATIYSDEIRNRVYRGQLSNGAFYDEWRILF
jgi:hypothetical protein